VKIWVKVLHGEGDGVHRFKARSALGDGRAATRRVTITPDGTAQGLYTEAINPATWSRHENEACAVPLA
jgi:hypothetical protein